MENNEFKPLTLGQSIKLGFFIFFFCIFLMGAFLLFAAGGITEFKEMVRIKGVEETIKSILYAVFPLALMVSLGIFIGYKNRKDASLSKKILMIQTPSIMLILDFFGISLETSNPKVFAFYYNLLFGIFLIILGFILFFTSGDYRIGLIPFVFGLVVIVVAILKRK